MELKTFHGDTWEVLSRGGYQRNKLELSKTTEELSCFNWYSKKHGVTCSEGLSNRGKKTKEKETKRGGGKTSKTKRGGGMRVVQRKEKGMIAI